MPDFYTSSGSKIHAEQWFPGRPVTGVMQPHFGSMTKFQPYITLTNVVCGGLTVPVSPGDWIVVDGNETFLVRHPAFKAMHRPADNESAIALGFTNLVDYESKREARRSSADSAPCISLPTTPKQNA